MTSKAKRKKRERETAAVRASPKTDAEVLAQTRDVLYRELVQELACAVARVSGTKSANFKLLDVPRIASSLVIALKSGFQAGNSRCLIYLDTLTCFGLDSLMGLAEHGSPDAASLLSKRLSHIAERFLLTCNRKPELFHSAARKRTTWPGLLSCERHYLKWCNEVRERIQLGRNTGLNYAGKLASSVESKIARSLFERIEAERKVPSWVEEMPPEMRKRYEKNEANHQTKLPKLVFDKRFSFLLNDDDDFVLRAGSKSLPDLSREQDVLAKWWKVMDPLFVKIYGKDFENRREFKSYRHSNHPTYRDLKGDEKRSAIRRDIKSKLKQGLRSIAAKQPDVINSKSI
jgi:hypothetical protein